MKAYLNSLNERERWMLLAGGLCLILYGYYFLLYSPLNAKVHLKSTQLTEKMQTLAWMKKVQGQADSKKTLKKLDNAQLLTLLATQLKDNQSLNFPYELQQTASGEIQLTFENVPFKAFISWLLQLNQQYAITIKQLDVDHTATPGVTHLMAVLSAAN